MSNEGASPATAPATAEVDFGEDDIEIGAGPKSEAPEKINKGLFEDEPAVHIDDEEAKEAEAKAKAQKAKAAKQKKAAAAKKEATKAKVEGPTETEDEAEAESEAEPEAEESEEEPEAEEAEEETEPEAKAEEETEEEDDNDFEVDAELTVDGKTTKHRYRLAELVRAKQFEVASQQRFEEASEMVKASQNMQKLFFGDPFGLLHREIMRKAIADGYDKETARRGAAQKVRELASTFLRPFIEEANLPEAERQKRQLDREIQERRQELEELKRKQEAEELEAKTQAFAQKRRRDIAKAMQQLGMEADEEIARRIDLTMWKHHDRGIQITPLEAAEEILREQEEYLRGYLERASPRQLLKLKPELGKLVAQTNLATVRRKQEEAIFGPGEEPTEEVPAEADQPRERRKKLPVYRNWEEAFPGDRRGGSYG